MGKEDYVSYDVAKILKEKGYSYGSTKFTVDRKTYEPLGIPTLYDAAKWLREERSTVLSVFWDEVDGWYYDIYGLADSRGEHTYDTYEGCMNAGILRALQ